MVIKESSQRNPQVHIYISSNNIHFFCQCLVAVYIRMNVLCKMMLNCKKGTVLTTRRKTSHLNHRQIMKQRINFFWKMKEGNKCYSCTFSLTKRVAKQRKILKYNKEKLINLSQNYRKLLLNEITIPNRKLLLQKKMSMCIQFVESMPVFFSKFSNWKVIAFLTIFSLFHLFFE